DLEPELRGAARGGRPQPSREPRNGGGSSRGRALRRRPGHGGVMDAFTRLNGVVVPIDRANVDTDAIIPKQFMKSIRRTGFGPNLFDEWRYLDRGEPGQDCSKRPLNPDFALNQARYFGAQVLLARENVGCGSSRE